MFERIKKQKREKVSLIKMNELHGMLMSVGFCVRYRVGEGIEKKNLFKVTAFTVI